MNPAGQTPMSVDPDTVDPDSVDPSSAARGLAETRIDGETAWTGRFLQVQVDRARLPDGSVGLREFIRHPGASVVVPLFDDGRVLIERQWRYPLSRAFIEFPAGKIDPGETPLATAARELEEETGWRAARIAHLTTIHNAIGYSDERIEVYVARDLTRVAQRLDVEEFVECEVVSLDWLLEEVFAHRVTDVKTQIAALWLERIASGRMPWPAFVPIPEPTPDASSGQSPGGQSSAA